jgi:hypothetical protein
MTGVSRLNWFEEDEEDRADEMEETWTSSEKVMCFPVLLVVETSELTRGGGLERIMGVSLDGVLLCIKIEDVLE